MKNKETLYEENMKLKEKEKEGYNQYKIRCYFETYIDVPIYGQNFEDALKRAIEIEENDSSLPLPNGTNYIEDSFEIDKEQVETDESLIRESLSIEMQETLRLGKDFNATKMLICNMLLYYSKNKYSNKEIDLLSDSIYDLYTEFDDVDLFDIINNVINKSIYFEDIEDLDIFDMYKKIMNE